MGENKWIAALIVAIVFIVCVVLIVLGQQRVGAAGLGMEVVGLLGILGLLYVYNKKYQ